MGLDDGYAVGYGEASHLSVSPGIMTKRAPLILSNKPAFEMKVNITDSELVIVEEASVWDTNAVILKVIFHTTATCQKNAGS